MWISRKEYKKLCGEVNVWVNYSVEIKHELETAKGALEREKRGYNDMFATAKRHNETIQVLKKKLKEQESEIVLRLINRLIYGDKTGK